MKKAWKVLILIAGILELILSVFVGFIGLLADAGAAAGGAAAVGGVIVFMFLITAGIGVALFILSLLIFKEENPGNGKVWTVTIIAGLSVIFALFSAKLPLGGVLFLVGGILLLVNNHNEKINPTNNNQNNPFNNPNNYNNQPNNYHNDHMNNYHNNYNNNHNTIDHHDNHDSNDGGHQE